MFSPFFVVKKDSSKMIEPYVKTVDSVTNVEISTSANIPLDAAIKANKLTSGEEYDRIIKLLDVDDSLTFDLNLYSKSLDRYITSLDDGIFEVRIPIPEKFKGKKLEVFYVGASNEPEKFEVKEENGYAVFNTNHFSIYTLGVTGDNSNTSVANPDTFDNIGSSIIMVIISLFGILGLLVWNKKNNLI